MGCLPIHVGIVCFYFHQFLINYFPLPADITTTYPIKFDPTCLRREITGSVFVHTVVKHLAGKPFQGNVSRIGEINST